MKQINEIKISVFNTQAIEKLEETLKPPMVEIIGDNDKGKTTLLNVISQSLGVPIKLDTTSGKDEGGSSMMITTKSGEVYAVEIKREGKKETIRLVTPDNKSSSGADAKRNLKDIFGMQSKSLEEVINLTRTPAGKRELNSILLNALPTKSQEKYFENLAIYTDSTKSEFSENAYNLRKKANASLTAASKLVEGNILSDDEVKILDEGDGCQKTLQDLEQDLSDIQEHNGRANLWKTSLANLESNEKSLKDQLAEIQDKIKTHKTKEVKEKDSSEVAERVEKGRKYVQDYLLISQKKQTVDQNNATVAKLREEVDGYNEEINAAREANKQIIKDADFGINNLEITDEGFSVNDISFEVESMSKSDMRKYASMLLKRASRVPVMLVDDVEGMNDKKVGDLLKEAKEGGYILIVSRFIPDADLQVINKVEIKEK